MKSRLKVFVSAYACEPHRGSDHGIGWRLACELARHHEVLVLTREDSRHTIEAALKSVQDTAVPRFAYLDLAPWLLWLKRRLPGGVLVYYYLWQLTAARLARRLHAEHGFDVAHHATFVRYWSPVAVAGLGIPYVIGPVGGGESAPRSTWPGIGVHGYLSEIGREAARGLAERDPLVRPALVRAGRVLAATLDSKQRIERLGSPCVSVEGVVGLTHDEIEAAASRAKERGRRSTFTFVSAGRLLHWKGFHLGLEAFARLPASFEAEYWIIGDGPFESRLKRLARDLGVAERVHFLGLRSRAETQALMGECHVLVHPSLHDSGGFVCLEAMAAGLPVVCLDLGGPGSLVNLDCGIAVPAGPVSRVVGALRAAMERLLEDRETCAAMGAAGRAWVVAHHTWEAKAERIAFVLSEAGAANASFIDGSPAALPD